MKNVLNVIGESNVLVGSVLVMIQKAKLGRKGLMHETR
jgi:hypothetical protein